MGLTEEERSAVTEKLPASPRRVIAFAHFFKNYMGVSSVVVAALPIPVTSLDLISVPAGMSKILSVYTSLFCFLILGMIFFSRHTLARYMFPSLGFKRTSFTILIRVFTHPLVYIIACIFCVINYHNQVGWMKVGVVEAHNILTMAAISYLGIFIFAEVSFILMAIKEYLQDLLKLSEIDLIMEPSKRGDSG
jgi:hypothetical protein